MRGVLTFTPGLPSKPVQILQLGNDNPASRSEGAQQSPHIVLGNGDAAAGVRITGIAMQKNGRTEPRLAGLIVAYVQAVLVRLRVLDDMFAFGRVEGGAIADVHKLVVKG